MFRTILFWLHLVAGCIAGVIVLVMSVTGVLLTYERQILAYTDRGAYQAAANLPPNAERLGPDALLERLAAQQPVPRNASLVLRANPAEPAEISLGREGSLYLNPYDGNVLGKGDSGTRRWFQKITAWHRWLGAEGEGRATAKAITGASNLAFLFLVISGLYLWMPKVWSRQHLRPITWFKSNTSGKARDFNWHNVFGFWMAVPLAIVVASAVPMSYQWGNALVYRLTGTEMPRPEGPPRGEGGPPRGERGPRAEGERPPRPSLDAAWARAVRQVPGWRTITLRLPTRPNADLAFTIDTGNGGQPQKRSTLTLDGATGEPKKFETFADQSAGRQLRMWTRFAHTGEYYGVFGQTIAGIASFAGVILVWTGLALAFRRFLAWRSRRSRAASGPGPAPPVETTVAV